MMNYLNEPSPQYFSILSFFLRLCEICAIFSLLEIDLLHEVVDLLLVLVLHQLTLQVIINITTAITVTTVM